MLNADGNPDAAAFATERNLAVLIRFVCLVVAVVVPDDACLCDDDGWT